MPQAVWTGAISFGLVNIPVRLYPATRPKDVRFHLYDRASGKRVRYERMTRDDEPPAFTPPAATDPGPVPREGTYVAEAPRDGTYDEPEARRIAAPFDLPPAQGALDLADIVRGFELPTGDLVTVNDEELASLAPERSRTIEVEEFVDLAQIDPIFFEKAYYLAPGRAMGADKPYALLHGAMKAAGKVAIGRFVLRTKPHLVAIRALGDALALETLFFGDEVRAPSDVIGHVPRPEVSERELRAAQQLIRALTTEWVPEKHADVYREELLTLLRSKRPQEPADADAIVTHAPVDDLMAQLKASVEAAKRRSAEADGRQTARRRGRSTRAG